MSSNTNPYALTTAGIVSWATGNRYVVHADIRKIYLKAYYNAVSLTGVHANAKGSVLVNLAGDELYSSNVANAVISTAVVAPNIGVHYMIIPKESRISGVYRDLPFTGSKGND